MTVNHGSMKFWDHLRDTYLQSPEMLLLLIMHYLQGMAKAYLAGEILQVIFFLSSTGKVADEVVILMHQQNLKVSSGERFIGASLIIDCHSIFGYTFAGQCHKCLKLARRDSSCSQMDINKYWQDSDNRFGSHLKNSKVTF